MSGFTIGIIVGLLMFVSLVFVKKDSKFSKFGINIGRVYCPKCNLKQPIIRKPANERQVLYGGYTCKNCNTEMDKYGIEIKD
ncbi:hypothetical protein [Flavobacterium helocola]|jgi:transposase-like protein|uniref:TRASH domain-containing protein n=1 Tax=Flavobacterium helocola TaxID=3139139 RepID=A0ABU9I422_9FLAO